VVRHSVRSWELRAVRCGVAAYYFRFGESASRFWMARRNFRFAGPKVVGSGFVVVAGDADDAGHVVVIVVFVGF